MWCIAGLGNPGDRYQSTRHNVGFEVVDLLSAWWKIPIDLKGPNYLFGSGDFGDIPVLLVKPMTYMNRSGQAYKRLLLEPEITPQQTIVILDDFSLPLGKLRIRKKGSDGGHNGLRSMIESAGTDELIRLRIGIDCPNDKWEDFVLEPFTKSERQVIDESIDRAASAVETILLHGVEKAMNEFNR